MLPLVTAAGCKSTSEAIESSAGEQRGPAATFASELLRAGLTLLHLTPIIDSVNTGMLPACVCVEEVECVGASREECDF